MRHTEKFHFGAVRFPSFKGKRLSEKISDSESRGMKGKFAEIL